MNEFLWKVFFTLDLLWVEFECCLQRMALFGNIVEPMGHGTRMTEVGHYGQALKFIATSIFSLLSLLPCPPL